MNSAFLVYSLLSNGYSKVPSFGLSLPEALSMNCPYTFAAPVSTHTDLQPPFVACFKSCCLVIRISWRFCYVFLHKYIFVNIWEIWFLCSTPFLFSMITLKMLHVFDFIFANTMAYYLKCRIQWRILNSMIWKCDCASIYLSIYLYLCVYNETIKYYTNSTIQMDWIIHTNWFFLTYMCFESLKTLYLCHQK